MKKCVTLALLICLVPLLSGCFLFNGGKTYDGSEGFYEAHPEYTNPPQYMQPGDSHSDGN
jgi:hypothetical protein